MDGSGYWVVIWKLVPLIAINSFKLDPLAVLLHRTAVDHATEAKEV